MQHVNCDIHIQIPCNCYVTLILLQQIYGKSIFLYLHACLLISMHAHMEVVMSQSSHQLLLPFLTQLLLSGLRFSFWTPAFSHPYHETYRNTNYRSKFCQLFVFNISQAMLHRSFLINREVFSHWKSKPKSKKG